MIKIIKIISNEELDSFNDLDSENQMDLIHDWRSQAIAYADEDKFELLIFSENHLNSFKNDKGKYLFVDKYEKTHDNGR